MPSLVADEKLLAHLQNPGVVHFDPARQYGPSDDKGNGHIPRRQQLPPQPSNDSSDTGSTDSSRSTQNTEASEIRAQMTGESSPPPSVGMQQNEEIVDWPLQNDSKTQPNGNTKTLIDRKAQPSRPKPLMNGSHQQCHGYPTEETARNSLGCGESGSAHSSPAAQHGVYNDGRNVINSESNSQAIPVHPNLVPPDIPSSSVTSSATPDTPTAEANARTPTSPHRYSSPPIYQATSGSLQQPPPPPPPGPLKQRHTLEVPKTNSTRQSRNSSDNAFASGRFSPVGAGGRRPSLNTARRNTRSMQSDVPRDGVVPDEDAQRWTEAYRAKRASKRKKKDDDDDRVLVGTKVDETHANWVTAYNMLTGIRVSVSRTNAKVDRELTDDDFVAKQKSTFDITGNELVPSAKYDFKFKDYAPWVFRHLRRLFKLDPADYLMSLTGKYILSELGSPGKSGSFFYFSRDYKYIIKTIHHAEHKFLRKILKEYYRHVTENPNTLLSQFYGLHRVKMPYGKKIHFVVMNNLFPPHRDIHQTYDLKGSTVGREHKEDDLERNPRATLKDLNWLRRNRRLELGIQKKRLFLRQLQQDVHLLQRLGIMDYSLLIGTHDLQKGNEEKLRDKTLMVFNPGGASSDESEQPHSVLMRTPSKLESQRKARELRQMIKAEGPVPLGETLPNELERGQNRSGFVFNEDDGGFRATHENNQPGDEIYYLGVIDCLTHYGVIKKIEHFWKGLTNDRSQISALPPQEYGERFLNFIEDVTMSSEEAQRVAQERDAALAAQAAEEEGQRRIDGNAERVASRGSTRQRTAGSKIPPIPEHQPHPPPIASPAKSSELEETVWKARQRAYRSQIDGTAEASAPEWVLKTSTSTLLRSPGHARPSLKSNGSQYSDRGSTAPALPVVQEAVEGKAAGSRGRISNVNVMTPDSDGRPLTPVQIGRETRYGLGDMSAERDGGCNGTTKSKGPPTPPKPGYAVDAALKPDIPDRGRDVTGSGLNGASGLRSASGSQKSLRGLPVIDRTSLEKALPPLPKTQPPPVPSQAIS